MAVVLTISSALPGMAMAAGKVKITTDTAWIGTEQSLYFDDKEFLGDLTSPHGTSMPDGAINKIVSVKSSKASILKVEKNSVLFNSVTLNAKKPGMCKVTVIYKNKAGKKITTAKTIRVKRMQDVFKTLEVNGRNVIGKEAPDRPLGYDYKGGVTIDVTLQPGWKLVNGKKQSYVWNLTMDDEGEDVVELDAFRNEMTVVKNEDYDSMLIKLTLQKQKEKVTFIMEI